MRIALVLASSLALSAGCASVRYQDFELTEPPRSAVITTEVILVETNEDVAQLCKQRGVPVGVFGLHGCASQKPDANGRHWIIGRKPRGWQDEEAVFVLGHELMHNLGAKHPE
ncbi:MAG: hypothetical protein HY526_07770 [Betaproteobacteria bacterium]|nr:hypothetical protein [Betaproteobacteria bacterium]